MCILFMYAYQYVCMYLCMYVCMYTSIPECSIGTGNITVVTIKASVRGLVVRNS